jgi:hypothetical protein
VVGCRGHGDKAFDLIKDREFPEQLSVLRGLSSSKLVVQVCEDTTL